MHADMKVDADRVVQWGLEKDPNNVHLGRLKSRLELSRGAR
jgi:hypothetical protein